MRTASSCFVSTLVLGLGCSSTPGATTLSPDAGAEDAPAGDAPIDDAPPGDAAPPAADWVIAVDPSQTTKRLDPALLGQYDLSGALLHYDQVSGLATAMKAAGLAEWRVGVGRWEFSSQLLPTLTDGTSCAAELVGAPPEFLAPAGSTELDLIKQRDWFTYTDGTPVTLAMTADDSRYALAYVRSVLDVAAAFGASPYVDVDLMPRALAANPTPMQSTSYIANACTSTFTNAVSNGHPADTQIFAAAVAGLVQRVVEGSGGEKGRPARYWEFWNEPELDYAWEPPGFTSYLQTAVAVLAALDGYRSQTTSPDGKAIRIGMGSFGLASTAWTLLPALDAVAQPPPLDFLSFHVESSDDPLVTVDSIQKVAAARAASAHYKSVELALSEWSVDLSGSTLDPNTMDIALYDATVLVLGAAAGLDRAHHAIFWDFIPNDQPAILGLLHYDLTPRPTYYAFTMLAAVIGAGSMRLAPAGLADGRLDGGMGAVLAAADGAGKVHVLLVNRGASARTARIDLPTGSATPARVRTLADPTTAPADGTPGVLIPVPAHSLVEVDL